MCHNQPALRNPRHFFILLSADPADLRLFRTDSRLRLQKQRFPARLRNRRNHSRSPLHHHQFRNFQRIHLGHGSARRSRLLGRDQRNDSDLPQSDWAGTPASNHLTRFIQEQFSPHFLIRKSVGNVSPKLRKSIKFLLYQGNKKHRHFPWIYYREYVGVFFEKIENVQIWTYSISCPATPYTESVVHRLQKRERFRKPVWDVGV